jgi:hypothetical protein
MPGRAVVAVTAKEIREAEDQIAEADRTATGTRTDHKSERDETARAAAHPVTEAINVARQ